MSMEWIRKRYGVPAKRGARVEYTGGKTPEVGAIVGAREGRLRIRLDGMEYTHPLPFHPTYELRYLDADTIKRCPKCGAGPLGNCGFYGCEIPRGTCPLTHAPETISVEGSSLENYFVQGLRQSESDVFPQQDHGHPLDEEGQSSRVFDNAPYARGILNSAVTNPVGISDHEAPRNGELKGRPAPVRRGTGLLLDAVHDVTEIDSLDGSSSPAPENQVGPPSTQTNVIGNAEGSDDETEAKSHLAEPDDELKNENIQPPQPNEAAIHTGTLHSITYEVD
jgi:hypothetical protein